jgi:hypothetical protein
MKIFTLKMLIIILLIPILSGCVKLVTQLSPSLIPNLTQTFFEECDPELARLSFPADLKLMEGLVKNDSQNKQLLTALCTGFTGYSMLFVEEEDPERASRLYLRARSYGFRALGGKGAFLKESGLNTENIRAKLNIFGEREFKALFYTTMSWHAWINLNLDKPAALAQMGIAQACLERVLELNPGYLYGTPYVLMGTIFAARPGLAGGNAHQAKVYFEKAMAVSKGEFYFVQYYFARYYAVRVQDRRLFRKLAQEAVQGHPSVLKDACLINSVMQQKAKKLLDMTEDLFL